MSDAADAVAERIRDSDVTLVVLVLFALYAAYVALGWVAGLGTQGMVATLVQLTVLVLIYAMLALSLNIQWGYTGLFNIGVVGFMAVGAYTMLMVSKPPAGDSPAALFGGLGLPVWVGLLAGIAAAALLGLLVALPALRLRADYLAIVTIAMAEIVRFVYQSSTFQEFSLLGIELGTGGGRGLLVNFDDPLDRLVFDTEAFGTVVEFLGELLGVGVSIRPVVQTAVVALVLLAFVVAFYWLLQRTGESPFGRVLKAIREDEDVARALGKDTRRFKVIAFMLGCGLMGLAGVMYGVYFLGQVNPTAFRPRLTFFVWVALIIGGAGSNTGSVIGSALFVGVLFQGPLYAKNALEELVTFGDAPSTIAGGFAGLLSLDPTPLLAYTFENISLFRIIALGVVLVWLMKRRPAGLLGHRLETASSIPLAPPADAAPTDEGGDGS